MIEDLIEFEALQNIADQSIKNSVECDLVAIGSDVVDGFDADLKSREGWEGEMKEAMDLALQVRETKNFPWRGASNVKMPLLTEAAIHYNSMMYPALIPPTDIVKARIVGEDHDGAKEAQSIRVSKHMSYQLLEEMEEWEEEMDIGLMIQPILGNMYKKTYFDPNKARNVSEMLSPAEFVVDYWTKSLSTAYRKTHVLSMTRNDIKKAVLSGDFLDIKLGDPKVVDMEKEGESVPTTDKSTPFKILEQHTYLDLDQDGLEEPYIITVEYDSKQVLRIVSGYSSENILVNANEEVYDVPQDQYFTKYGFVPNPDGAFLDLGLGKLLGPTNHTVNTLMNQLIDAGTRSVTGGGFLGRGIKMKGGSLKFQMGEYKRIDCTGSDIRQNIYDIKVPEPSGVLFNLLGLLINHAQRLSSTLDSQVGENPGQNQKATTSAIVQENGQKIFNGIYKRNHRSLKKECKLIFLLNSVNLPSESYLNLLDGNLPKDMEQSIARADYNPKSLNIVPAADSAYTSQQQRMAKSRALMEKIGTGMINPQEAMKRALIAEEQHGIELLMKVEPRQPSLEEKEFEHTMKLDMAKHNLEILKSKREDLKVRSDAIAKLMTAEAIEPGQQLNAMKLKLEGIVRESEDNDRKFAQAQQQMNQPPQQEVAQG